MQHRSVSSTYLHDRCSGRLARFGSATPSRSAMKEWNCTVKKEKHPVLLKLWFCKREKLKQTHRSKAHLVLLKREVETHYSKAHLVLLKREVETHYSKAHLVLLKREAETNSLQRGTPGFAKERSWNKLTTVRYTWFCKREKFKQTHNYKAHLVLLNREVQTNSQQWGTPGFVKVMVFLEREVQTNSQQWCGSITWWDLLYKLLESGQDCSIADTAPER